MEMAHDLDLLWTVDRSMHQISVRIRTGTAIQVVRLRFPQLAETAPNAVWISAGCRLLAEALEGLPNGRVTDLPLELTGF